MPAMREISPMTSTKPSGGFGAMSCRGGAGGTACPKLLVTTEMSPITSTNVSLFMSGGHAFTPQASFASVPVIASARSANPSPSESTLPGSQPSQTPLLFASGGFAGRASDRIPIASLIGRPDWLLYDAYTLITSPVHRIDPAGLTLHNDIFWMWSAGPGGGGELGWW